jgi:hypothetical protein
MTTNVSVSSSSHTLLDALTRELYQAEQSAMRQCLREAARLGTTPPGLAVRAVGVHADAVLRELPGLSRRNGLPTSQASKRTGAAFSGLRDKLLDMLVDRERSYRGTLLGCRHGLDVVRTTHHLASGLGNLDLDAFCSSWLNTRIVLVQRVEDELAWFAANPDEATTLARPLVAGLRARLRVAS